MFKLKASVATMCLALSGTTFAADNITWEPHVRDGYMCSGAPNYCNISGMAKVHIENTSDEDHSYTVNIGMSSDGGVPVGGAGQWSQKIVIPAHGVWDTQQTVAGYVKFNNRGQRQVAIIAYTNGYQEFYKMQQGWITVI